MFTGIVEYIGTIKQITPAGSGKKFTIDVGHLADGLKLGDSIATNGICLTASKIAGSLVDFDAVAETLSRSNLGNLRPGSKVNLERALAANGRLDGHIVQGHVDTTATVKSITRSDAWEIFFSAPADMLAQLAPKGSVCISGVSLTIASLSADNFSVAIIPTTLKDTTLVDLNPGDTVNIELDIIGKYVKRYLTQMLSPNTPADKSGGITLEKLMQEGFM